MRAGRGGGDGVGADRRSAASVQVEVKRPHLRVVREDASRDAIVEAIRVVEDELGAEAAWPVTSILVRALMVAMGGKERV